jgi:hypothetical protein
MNLDEELQQIMDDAYKNIARDGLLAEMEDFIHVEEELNDNNPVLNNRVDMWYMTTEEVDDGRMQEYIELDFEGRESLFINYADSFSNASDFLGDQDRFKWIKKAEPVGIISRFSTPSGKDDLTTRVTVLMTQRGAHVIVRKTDDTLICESIPKREIYKQDMKFLSSFFDACFTW